MKKKNILLALDVSTTTIGIAVFKYSSWKDKKLIHYDYYKPNKKKKSLKSFTSQEMLDMILGTRDFVLALVKKYKVTDFAIEDYIRYMGGKSAAATVIPLAILNMTLRIAVLDNFKISPVPLNVLKIRHALKKDKKLPPKEDIPDLVAHHLEMKEFPWYKRLNRKKEEVIMDESYDVADAIAVGLCQIKSGAELQCGCNLKNSIT